MAEPVGEFGFMGVDRETFLPPQKTVDALRAELSGPGGTPIGHVHNQGFPSVEWTIVHDLDFLPNITVVDSAGSVVIGDVEYLPDGKTIILRFGAPFSGRAHLS